MFNFSIAKIFISNQEDTKLQRFAPYYNMFDLRKQKNQIMQVNTFKAAYIDKTVIKLTEEVILNMGITFEPMVDGTYFNNGTFNTRLHYKVLLTNPIYAPNLERA